MVIFRAAVDRKTLPQQNRVESLYTETRWNKKLVSRLSPDSAEILWPLLFFIFYAHQHKASIMYAEILKLAM